MGKPAPLGVGASGLPNLGDQANAVVTQLFTGVGPGRFFAFRGWFNLFLYGAINTALTTTAGSTAATVASASGLAVGDAINSVNAPPGTTIGALAGVDVTLALPTLTLLGVANAQQAQISGLASTAGLLGATVSVPSDNEGYVLPANTTVTAILTAAVPPTNDGPGVRGVVAISAAPTAVPLNNGQQPFDFALTGSAVAAGTDNAALFTGAAIDYTGSIQLEKSFDGGKTCVVASLTQAGALAQWAAGTPVATAFAESEKNMLYRLNVTALSSASIYSRISQTGVAAESLGLGAPI